MEHVWLSSSVPHAAEVAVVPVIHPKFVAGDGCPTSHSGMDPREHDTTLWRTSQVTTFYGGWQTGTRREVDWPDRFWVGHNGFTVAAAVGVCHISHAKLNQVDTGGAVFGTSIRR